jgi:FixJ family two-component response regulator
VTLPADPAKATIIVVDDDIAFLHSLQFALEIEGLAVRLYPSAAGLLAGDVLPETGCLVIDYHLEGMNGLDLIAALRDRGVVLPAILITVQPSASMLARASALGVPIIEKPFLENDLLIGIREALALQRAA